MNVYQTILETIEKKGGVYFILLDPDKIEPSTISEFLKVCEDAGVDGFLVGGSLIVDGNLESSIEIIKKYTSLPLIIFPGSVDQLSPKADALLYLSLISGRNAEHLIGKHVLAAPTIKKFSLEAISTGYMLIESGRQTTAEYISGTRPIPRNKPEIAVSTALAAQYLGMKLIYLEGGSGADNHVPFEMINSVSNEIDIPLIVGGGIRNPDVARQMVKSGANIIVTGNYLEDKSNWNQIKDFSSAVHVKLPVDV